MRRPSPGWGGTALVALALLVPLSSHLGHPVVAFARSGSMEPALGIGDVFLVNPFARDPRVGDVVVFEASAGLTVHRVVAGDDSGYVTMGDANRAPDQVGGEPPVTPDRLRGTVVTLPDGTVPRVPHAGLLVLEAQAAVRGVAREATPSAAAWLALAAGVALLVLPERRRPASLAPTTPPASPAPAALAAGLRGRHVGLLALLLLGLTLAAWVASTSSTVGVGVLVVPDAPAGQAVSASPGAAVPRELEVFALPLLPTVVVVEAGTSRVAVHDASLVVPAGGTATARLTLVAGDARGPQREEVRVWRYPALLPPEAVAALHARAPGAPAALAAALPLALAALWYASLGAGALPASVLLDPGRRGAP